MSTVKTRKRIAIITGAAGGIGSATARLLHEKGVGLVLADINRKGAERLASELGEDCLAVVCDITRVQSVKAMVKKALERFGRVDILVNNAGIIFPGLFENANHKEIQRQIDVNLIGPITCAREVLPHMIGRGSGHIVTISSLAGIVPETYSSIYTATKFALRGWSLALGLELARRGIRTSAIFPDSVNTPMLRYEAAHGGSPLTFLNPPQSPEAVARAVYEAVEKRRPELCVPAGTGFFSRLIMAFPSIVMRVWPMLERQGAKKKKALLRSGVL